MKKILIGLLFIFFDISIEYEGLNVGLLPACIGYALLALGIRDLLKRWDSSNLRLASLLSIFAVAITAIEYLFDLLALDLGVITVSWSALCLALLLGITLLLVLVVGEIEKKASADLGSRQLRLVWMLMALLQLVGFILPRILPSELLSAILLTATLVCNVLFLIFFCRSQQRYDGDGQSQ
ncbi:MAG: hypothetical protein LUF80_00420 [Oscillospiraceae bacterium]|nr:hypothetical protein [Oscillospiraceae bacterium]